jgi:hypothetical protein
MFEACFSCLLLLAPALATLVIGRSYNHPRCQATTSCYDHAATGIDGTKDLKQGPGNCEVGPLTLSSRLRHRPNDLTCSCTGQTKQITMDLSEAHLVTVCKA